MPLPQTILKSSLLLTLLLSCLFAFSQKKDTVLITPATIKMANLPEGHHRYLVYFLKGKDSSRTNFQYWNLHVYTGDYKGKQAIITDQYWEDNTDIMHTAFSVSDKKDFHPLYQVSWWKGRDTIISNFEEKTASLPDKLFRKNIDSSRKAAMAAYLQACNEYTLNWHLDLQAFSLLPYKDGRTFGINFYDAGFSAPKLQYYTVTGSGIFTGYGNEKIDCWLLYKEDPNNKETFWISKKTKEVLKLEQQFGNMYRFKIKQPS